MFGTEKGRRPGIPITEDISKIDLSEWNKDLLNKLKTVSTDYSQGMDIIINKIKEEGPGSFFQPSIIVHSLNENFKFKGGPKAVINSNQIKYVAMYGRSPPPNILGETIENDYSAYIDSISRIYEVDSDLVRSIISVESHWNPNAISACGATGLGQLIPETARSLSSDSKLAVPRYGTGKCDGGCAERIIDSGCNSCDSSKCDFVNDERFNPQKNIRATAEYISVISKQISARGITSSIQNVAAAYNSGPERVITAKGVPNIKETKEYVVKVSNEYNSRKGTA